MIDIFRRFLEYIVWGCWLNKDMKDIRRPVFYQFCYKLYTIVKYIMYRYVYFDARVIYILEKKKNEDFNLAALWLQNKKVSAERLYFQSGAHLKYNIITSSNW